MSTEQKPSNVSQLWKAHLVSSKAKDGRKILAHEMANAVTILRHDERWSGVVAFDLFRSTVTTTRPPPWHPDDAPLDVRFGDLTDADVSRTAAWLRRSYGIKLSRDVVGASLMVVAESNVVHPVRDYLNGLSWDGTSRVESLLSSYFGAEDSAYTRFVSRMILVSAVARIMQPGCKSDCMAVLEGKQGRLKSTGVKTLFGEKLFSDSPIDWDSKDRFLSLQGAWVVEVAELDGMGKADANRIKSFLSSATDRYRPPYGKNTVTVGRQSILIGTTNGTEYLQDATGNRRFMPVATGVIDIDAIARDRDLLWAEAVVRYRAGATWWPSADEAEPCREQQAERMQVDAWQGRIEEALARKTQVTVADILGDTLCIETGRWSQADMNRVARCMKIAGWRRRRVRDGNRLRWVYEPEPEVVDPPNRSDDPDSATWTAVALELARLIHAASSVEELGVLEQGIEELPVEFRRMPRDILNERRSS